MRQPTRQAIQQLKGQKKILRNAPPQTGHQPPAMDADAMVWQALDNNNADQLAAALKQGGAANQWRNNMTPLMQAATLGNRGGCELLLAHGAEILSCDRRGYGAAGMAWAHGHPELQEWLKTIQQKRRQEIGVNWLYYAPRP